MTEEQEAWFNFGHAMAGYKCIKTLFACHSVNRIWKGSAEARTVIQNAWDARKEAMAWNPRDGRSCSNCKHWYTSDELQSQECEYCGHLRSNWTPLEEEGGEQ